MADSLSEKEQNIDLFERQVLQATSRRTLPLSTCTAFSPSSSTSFQCGRRRRQNKPSFTPSFSQRPWMSTVDLKRGIYPSVSDDESDSGRLSDPQFLFRSNSTIDCSIDLSSWVDVSLHSILLVLML